MDNIIDLEERKKNLKSKQDNEIKRIENSAKLNEFISDIETVLDMISREEIKELTLMFNFRGHYCYYGRDENLDLKTIDQEKIKEEVDKISKEARFK